MEMLGRLGRGAGTAAETEEMQAVIHDRLKTLLAHHSEGRAIFLLYLNNETFIGDLGDNLADELRVLRRSFPAVRIFLAHQQDPLRAVLQD